MTERILEAEQITKAEAAEILGVSVRTVERYMTDGDLIPIKYRTGKVRLDRAAVVALGEPISAGGVA